MNIALIGPRGSGKTSIGRVVAADRGRRFIDLDDRVLERFPGLTVTEVWQVHGETAWRAAEVDALRDVLAEDGVLIAMGGGTPTIEPARRAIDAARRDGRLRVIYLRCGVEELRTRLEAGAGDRPPLTGRGVIDEIREVLAAREPAYLAVADLVWDGGDGATLEQGIEGVRALVAGEKREMGQMEAGTQADDGV